MILSPLLEALAQDLYEQQETNDAFDQERDIVPWEERNNITRRVWVRLAEVKLSSSRARRPQQQAA